MPTSAARESRRYRDELMQNLIDTQNRLWDAHARFNQATQPELIEQCVYEINAWKARHAYFMRLLREIEEESA